MSEHDIDDLLLAANAAGNSTAAEIKAAAETKAKETRLAEELQSYRLWNGAIALISEFSDNVSFVKTLARDGQGQIIPYDGYAVTLFGDDNPPGSKVIERDGEVNRAATERNVKTFQSEPFGVKKFQGQVLIKEGISLPDSGVFALAQIVIRIHEHLLKHMSGSEMDQRRAAEMLGANGKNPGYLLKSFERMFEANFGVKPVLPQRYQSIVEKAEQMLEQSASVISTAKPNAVPTTHTPAVSGASQDNANGKVDKHPSVDEVNRLLWLYWKKDIDFVVNNISRHPLIGAVIVIFSLATGAFVPLLVGIGFGLVLKFGYSVLKAVTNGKS